MNYWVKRALQIEDREYTRSNKLILDLEKEFSKARAGIERDINYYLERICIDNKLSYTEAKRKLKKGELEVFRLSLDDYIKKGQGVLTEVTIQELRNASNLYNISRLQAMGLEMKKHVDYLYAKYLDKTKNFLSTTYEQSFYQSMYDLQMVTGVKHLTKLDNQMLEKIIKRPWLPDNKNFSDRIWENQNKLVNELQKVLMQKAIMQTDMQECIETLAKRMDVSFSNAKRLVQTENAYFTTQALTDSYKKGSCKMYENVATLDNKTSEICQSMDGTKFKFSDMEIGINAPPFHAHCRTVIVPAYNDEIERELDEEAGRIARNPITGKTEHISNMKYDEWYKRYVISNEKAKVIEKQYKNRHSDRKQYDNYVSVLGRETVGNIGKFKDLKYNDNKEWEKLQDKYYIKNKFLKGIWKDEINFDKQKRHIKSTVGKNKSYFEDTVDVKALYEKYKMTGEIYIKNGIKTHKELIDFVEDIDAFDVKRGKKANGMTIHYSKTGVHLVPTYHKED